MRVTGGKVKGQVLKVPKSHSVRPTTDLARQVIFSILENTASDWSRVLDLYAGSGALGIEALSREAKWADFIDQKPQCCAIIKENLEKTKLASQAHVYCCPANKAVNFLNGKYNIIFVDPPYSDPSINNLLTSLATSKLMTENSLIVVPHSSRSSLEPAYDGLHLIKERQHGDTCISVYQKEVGI